MSQSQYESQCTVAWIENFNYECTRNHLSVRLGPGLLGSSQCFLRIPAMFWEGPETGRYIRGRERKGENASRKTDKVHGSIPALLF